MEVQVFQDDVSTMFAFQNIEVDSLKTLSSKGGYLLAVVLNADQIDVWLGHFVEFGQLELGNDAFLVEHSHELRRESHVTEYTLAFQIVVSHHEFVTPDSRELQ